MKIKKMLAAASAIALMLGVAACNSDSDSAHGSEGLTKVTLSLPPASPSGAYQLGKDKGFFKEEGIDLQLVVNQGGAAVIPGVVAGNPQFATSNSMSALTATDKGIPIKAIAPGSADHAPPDPGMYGVVAPKGSDLKKTGDLENVTIAVNTLKGLGEFTVREAITKAGGDPDTDKFVEIPFPDMPAALKNKRVDAVWVPEPFLTQLTSDGTGQLVGYTTQESYPGLAVVIFTRDNTDKGLIERMRRAIIKSAEYAQAHTEETQVAAAKFTGLPVATVKAAGMENFPTKIDTDSINEIAARMQALGWIKDGPKAAQALLQ
jgi:NitT/TauT family transport system substrate-binding protein